MCVCVINFCWLRHTHTPICYNFLANEIGHVSSLVMHRKRLLYETEAHQQNIFLGEYANGSALFDILEMQHLSMLLAT